MQLELRLRYASGRRVQRSLPPLKRLFGMSPVTRRPAGSYTRARGSKDSADYLRFALNGCGSLMRPSDHATQKPEPAR